MSSTPCSRLATIAPMLKVGLHVLATGRSATSDP